MINTLPTHAKPAHAADSAASAKNRQLLQKCNNGRDIKHRKSHANGLCMALHDMAWRARKTVVAQTCMVCVELTISQV